jgi:RNA polymerase sigma factor (sigma-70 family)
MGPSSVDTKSGGSSGQEQGRVARFEAVVLPHLDAAYNLARWLTRDEHAAEDLVQDAVLRGMKFFGSFRGEDGKAWILAIVRNLCFDWFRRRRNQDAHDSFDEDIHSATGADSAGDGWSDPAAWADTQQRARWVREALESLPPEHREALVLRELEGLSYKEIATISAVPLGTVMSRLARARSQLRTLLQSTSEGS